MGNYFHEYIKTAIEVQDLENRLLDSVRNNPTSMIDYIA